MTDVLYVPWHRRSERWRHDHNTGDEYDWQPEKVVAVGRLIRISHSWYESYCPCGALFVADADRQNIIYPSAKAIGIV